MDREKPNVPSGLATNGDKTVWISLIAFVVSFSLTFLVGRLTLAPGVGPGAAGAWAAGALGKGSAQTSVHAPLFHLLTCFCATICPARHLAVFLNHITLAGHAVVAGCSSLILLAVFRWRNIWVPVMLATWGGALVGVTRCGWASGLMVNPAPWSLAAMFAAWSLVGSLWNRGARESRGRQRLLLAFWLMGLAVAFHLAAVMVLPAFIVVMVRLCSFKDSRTLIMAATGLLLPSLLFLLTSTDTYFNVQGLFVAAPGISELDGFAMIGWAGLWALTPAALPFSVWGLICGLRHYPESRILLLLLFAGIIIAGFTSIEAVQYAALLLTVMIALLASLGIADLLGRLPGGLAIGLWILIPLAWWGHGSILNRSGESIWETHVKNVIRTVRLNSLVLSLDDELVNASYAYLRAAKSIRPDVALLNPIHLANPDYLDAAKREYGKRLDPVRDSLDSLELVAGSSTAEPGESSKAMRRFLANLVSHEVSTNGVLVSPGYSPPVSGYDLIPEGLLVRVLAEGQTAYPFHFIGLDMDPILIDPDAPLLYQRLVALYPMMFSTRGSWMLRKQYSAEGMEYIRWALKIDPDYIPAKILAREYGIYGPPQYLGK